MQIANLYDDPFGYEKAEKKRAILRKVSNVYLKFAVVSTVAMFAALAIQNS